MSESRTNIKFNPITLKFNMFIQNIIGDSLTMEKSQYDDEYIAKWRGLTVATVAKQPDGSCEVTEWHPDQESTYSPDRVCSLDAAWRHIKGYCLGEFDDMLKEQVGHSGGYHR